MIKTQYELQEAIADKANIHIVTCGNCGKVLLHEATEGEITCEFCDYIGEPCDFPDLHSQPIVVDVFKKLGNYFRP